MTFTQIVNAIWCLTCSAAIALSNIPPETFPKLSTLLPDRYKTAITIAAALALAAKSHRNLFVNPDGTPARLPYIADDNKSVKKDAFKAGV